MSHSKVIILKKKIKAVMIEILPVCLIQHFFSSPSSFKLGKF